MAAGIVLEKSNEYNTKVTAEHPDYDGLWKRIIGELFEEFLLFFAPDLHREIDFTRPPDFLQQELFQEIIRRKKGRVYVDQIVKVFLKNGVEKWIIIHIEVQGESEEDLSERMFRYFYRIFDKHARKIFAIALRTDDAPSKKPDQFTYSFHGTKVNYTYNVYKFHEHTIEELEQSTNPFAAAVIAGKYAVKYKHDEEKRYFFKRELMLQVLRRFPLEYQKSREYISALFHFIDYILHTPEEFEPQLREALIDNLEKEGEQPVQSELEKMKESPTLAAIIEHFEKISIEKAKDKGIEQGIQKGMHQGMQQGIQKGKQQGMHQGMQKGKQQAQLDFAEKLIKEGFSDEKITNLTGLELERVQVLRKSLNI